MPAFQWLKINGLANLYYSLVFHMSRYDVALTKEYILISLAGSFLLEVLLI